MNKTGSGDTSARNQTSSKMLSKTSSKSFKNSRRSSNKKMRGTHKEDVAEEIFSDKLTTITNSFNKSKSLLHASKLRKKRIEKAMPDGVKKIHMDKIKFKSPKAHSLGKKLSKIKLNGRNNKFKTNQSKNTTHNVSSMNSARSKGQAASGSKECKKSIKTIKKDYILKPGEGKLRFTKKVMDQIVGPQLISKNPIKILKKISPGRQKPDNDQPAFQIAIDRVSNYNNYCKLSGRTKQSSDSGSNVLIRKNSNVSRKVRETNNSRGNKTHLIFLEQHHSSKIVDSKVASSNFSLSGPVNLRDGQNIAFESTILQTRQAIIARDSNKSQQLIPDGNSTLAYTGG